MLIMETYNIVGQYYLSGRINVAFLYYIFCNYADNQEGAELNIKTVKFRKSTWGDPKNKKTFKNALHVEFTKPKVSTKFFPGGLIHISGIKDTYVLESFVLEIKKILEKHYRWESVESDDQLNKYYSQSLKCFCYCIKGPNAVLFIQDDTTVYSDYDTVIECRMDRGYFTTGNTLKNLKILTTEGLEEVILDMPNRKNIPTISRFYEQNNTLYYSYNHKKFAELIFPENTVLELPSVVELTPFKPDPTLTEHFVIHNINKGFTVEKPIKVSVWRKKLASLGVEHTILKQKTEIINFYFWTNGKDIFCKQPENGASIQIKLQIYNDKNDYTKVRFSTKIDIDPSDFINQIVESILSDHTKINYEITTPQTLLELYEYI